MNFSCRKNKDGVTRGFLKCFKQGVKGGIGQHVDFVDDVDPVRAMKRCEFDVFTQFTDIVHAGVRRSVNLDDIHRVAPGDFNATWAGSTGMACGTLFTVKGLGQDARDSGFADSPHAGEDIGMGDAFAVDRIGECLHDMGLPQDFLKIGRAVFSCGNLKFHNSR